MDQIYKATTNYCNCPGVFKTRCLNTNVLGLDLGQKKVGVAMGNMALRIATPLEVLHYNSLKHLRVQLLSIIKQYEIRGMVVGAASQEISYVEAIQAFMELLNLALPFCLEDETYTTKIANQALTALGIKRKKRHQVDDKIAAQLILSSFFDRLDVF